MTRHRLDPEEVDRLREWMREIPSRRAEALETLEHEGMRAEAAFLERAEDGDYLVYYMEADDIERVYERYESSPYEIDREHRDLLEDAIADDQPDEEIELLYHLAPAREE